MRPLLDGIHVGIPIIDVTHSSADDGRRTDSRLFTPQKDTWRLACAQRQILLSLGQSWRAAIVDHVHGAPSRFKTNASQIVEDSTNLVHSRSFRRRTFGYNLVETYLQTPPDRARRNTYPAVRE